MSITFSATQDFAVEQLGQLFTSVGWKAGEHPERLQAAMRNSAKVISAWDGDVLIGLVNALSDGVMVAYVHYLLVRPDYQRRGLGRELLSRMLAEYEGCARKLLVTDDDGVGFYERCGFEAARDCTPMVIDRAD